MIELTKRAFAKSSPEDYKNFLERFGALPGTLNFYHIGAAGDRADAERMLFLTANAPGEARRQMGLDVEQEKDKPLNAENRSGRL